MKILSSLFVRNFVFGVEDSLVSTAGLLTGIAAAEVPRATILLTGATLVFVEAFSMATGSFLSEQSVEDLRMAGKKRHVHSSQSFFGGAVMFLSYVAAGVIPLFPYAIFEREQGLLISVAVSLATLFFLGAGSGFFARRHILASGLRMLALGSIAMLVGTFVGFVAQM